MSRGLERTQPPPRTSGTGRTTHALYTRWQRFKSAHRKLLAQCLAPRKRAVSARRYFLLVPLLGTPAPPENNLYKGKWAPLPHNGSLFSSPPLPLKGQKPGTVTETSVSLTPGGLGSPLWLCVLRPSLCLPTHVCHDPGQISRVASLWTDSPASDKP